MASATHRLAAAQASRSGSISGGNAYAYQGQTFTAGNAANTSGLNNSQVIATNVVDSTHELVRRLTMAETERDQAREELAHTREQMEYWQAQAKYCWDLIEKLKLMPFAFAEQFGKEVEQGLRSTPARAASYQPQSLQSSYSQFDAASSGGKLPGEPANGAFLGNTARGVMGVPMTSSGSGYKGVVGGAYGARPAH